MIDSRRLEILGRLRRHRLKQPVEESSDWREWTALVELDGHIAGALASALGGEAVDSVRVDSWRRAVSSNQRWAELWPEEVELLEAACDALHE